MKRSLFILLLLFSGISHVWSQTGQEYFELAMKDESEENYYLALLHISYALKADSTNVSYLLAKASFELDLKRYSDALATFNQGIQLYPDLDIFYSRRSILQMELGMYRPALIDASRAYDRAKNDTERVYLLSNRAAVEIKTRDFNAAYNDLKKALTYDPKNIGALINLANVCRELKQNKEAIKLLNQVIRLQPGDETGYHNLGFQYLTMHQYQKAISYFDTSLTMSPDDAMAYNNRGYCRLMLGDVDGALEDINYSISAYPANSYGYRNRALVYLKQNKIESACEDLHKAIDLQFTINYGDEVENLIRKHCL